MPDGLHVEELTLGPSGLLLLARATAAQAVCPICGHASSWVHSRYWRTLKDLPWQDRAVTWRVQVRRFRCSRCPGRVFVERIPGLMRLKARRTMRVAEAQAEIGLVLGGEARARLSRRLSMAVSGDTILRLIGRHPPRVYPAPRVVGIDDWAWRRGHRYGTIVCDPERRRVLALLPRRSSAPIREWLAARPDITVVSRDRAGPYSEAARIGAPAAIQMATDGTFWSMPPKHSAPSWRGTTGRSRRLPDLGLLPASRPPCPRPRRPCRNGARTAAGASTTSCVLGRRAFQFCRSRTGPDWPAIPCADTCAPARTSCIDVHQDRACSTVIAALPKRAGRKGSAAAPRCTGNSRLRASVAVTTSFDAGSHADGTQHRIVPPSARRPQRAGPHVCSRAARPRSPTTSAPSSLGCARRRPKFGPRPGTCGPSPICFARMTWRPWSPGWTRRPQQA